jgi:acid phosphatase
LVAGLGLVGQKPASPSPASSLAQGVLPPEPAHDQTLAVLWQQRSAEYHAACLQAYRTAATMLRMLVEDPTVTACLEQGPRDQYQALPPAVVLDVDETVLDNSVFAARGIVDAQPFSPAAWSAWVAEARASAVPGALGYVRTAVELGCRVVYVTNRRSDVGSGPQRCSEEADTRRNLLALGFPIHEAEGEDVVWTADELGDKSTRRAKVAERFRIVQLVGDNLGDFAPGTELPAQRNPADTARLCADAERNRLAVVEACAGWWGERWILLPNPCYGGFESVVRGQFDSLRSALRTAR